MRLGTPKHYRLTTIGIGRSLAAFLFFNRFGKQTLTDPAKTNNLPPHLSNSSFAETFARLGSVNLQTARASIAHWNNCPGRYSADHEMKGETWMSHQAFRCHRIVEYRHPAKTGCRWLKRPIAPGEERNPLPPWDPRLSGSFFYPHSFSSVLSPSCWYLPFDAEIYDSSRLPAVCWYL